MMANCRTCKTPIEVERRLAPLCNACIRYLNSLSNKEFADVAITCFGKTREEANRWLTEVGPGPGKEGKDA
jgi:hypothetical protein